MFDSEYPSETDCSACDAIHGCDSDGKATGLIVQSTDGSGLWFSIRREEATLYSNRPTRRYLQHRRWNPHSGIQGQMGEAYRPHAVPESLRHSNDAAQSNRVRPLDSQHVDFGALQALLDRCTHQHSTCTPSGYEELNNVFLIDVNERKLVRFPTNGCSYVALSYVWGDFKPPRFQYGTLPPRTAKTIDDAMLVVQGLGLRYLWTDMICINQADRVHLSAQIGIMNAIYSGAHATIVAIAGENADTGLPGMSSAKSRHKQHQSIFGANRLLSIGPALNDQLLESRWLTRAWIVQEAILSRRCFVWSDFQVHFICNGMQSSEVADHLDRGDERPFLRGISSFHNPFLSLPPIREIEERYRLFDSVFANYMERDITSQADRLKAVAGLMNQFSQNLFP